MFFVLLILFGGVEAVCGERLVLSTVIFRHGARAPLRGFEPQYAQLFSNGLGEMTDPGVRNSVELGRFLRRRYVDSGFLDSSFKASEVFFRSTPKNRCLMTAAAVGSGMFSNHTREVFVPVYSQHDGDRLLQYPWTKCTYEPTVLQRYCPNVDIPPFSTFKSFPHFEGFIFECLGLHKNATYFKSGQDFVGAEELIVQEQNGLDLPGLDVQSKQELHETFNKVFRFMIGGGEFHDARLMRMKGGFFMHTVVDNLRIKWDCHIKGDGECKQGWSQRKFIAYSTQDWLIMLILDMMGAMEAAVGGACPEFNSMIILELWDDEGKPTVKLSYKHDSWSPQAVDLSEHMTACQGKGSCSFEKWAEAIRQYTTDDPDKDCYITRNHTDQANTIRTPIPDSS